MLPNTLCIGASRSGTTWLDHQLRGHPEIYLPEKRKEVSYFNKYYDRGEGWYESFFNSKASKSAKIVAEISPGYLSCNYTPERINQTLDCKRLKIIVMLRDPVERAYSQWAYRLQKRGEKASFSEYVRSNEEPIRLSLYGRSLTNYFRYFDPSSFHLIFFNDLKENPLAVLSALAEFLEVDSGFFLHEYRYRVPNSSYLPRFDRLYRHAFKVKQYLRKNDLDWIVNVPKSLGIEAIFGNRGRVEKLDENTYRSVFHFFEKDTANLKKLLQTYPQYTSCSDVDLDTLWKSSQS